ncbi:uncharacterized protein M421DRAFT_363999 [Didymella exigua CBS 183.55]|uniref:Uncharacterized protein n=1 Tax=Didymella exigua CBS 183.55 TaxID=1150837 RepID=A0A6A5RRL4_9PLEO|nr:uncharacterized protein M421DRAFT_363999 [Didymella exigua CBS 183.55]KAF1930995.1 hypothetical protein M421DRAFT_363999 [Didymella exigua CBS 183.55]
MLSSCSCMSTKPCTLYRPWYPQSTIGGTWFLEHGPKATNRSRLSAGSVGSLHAKTSFCIASQLDNDKAHDSRVTDRCCVRGRAVAHTSCRTYRGNGPGSSNANPGIRSCGAQILSSTRARCRPIRCSDKPVAGGRFYEACRQPSSPELPRGCSARRTCYCLCNWRSCKGQGKVKSWRHFRDSSRGYSECPRAVAPSQRSFTGQKNPGIT